MGKAGKLGLKHLHSRLVLCFFRLPVSNISVDKYKQIVYVEFSHLGASLNPGTIALQMRWVVSGKLSCVLQCHLHSRLLGGVATLCISCNFLGAHVLLTSLEKWLLPQNNPISVIILTFKWHSMVKTSHLCWQECSTHTQLRHQPSAAEETQLTASISLTIYFKFIRLRHPSTAFHLSERLTEMRLVGNHLRGEIHPALTQSMEPAAEIAAEGFRSWNGVICIPLGYSCLCCAKHNWSKEILYIHIYELKYPSDWYLKDPCMCQVFQESHKIKGRRKIKVEY